MNLLKIRIGVFCGALLAIMALSHCAYAGAECASLGGACDDGGWNPMAKLDEIGTGKYDQAQTSPNWPEKSRETRWNMPSKSQDKPQNESTATNQEKSKTDEVAKQSRFH